MDRPEFDRAAVFAEVDKSNLRFENYTEAQKSEFMAAVLNLPDDYPTSNIITGAPTTIGAVRKAARESAQNLLKAFGKESV